MAYLSSILGSAGIGSDRKGGFVCLELDKK
jgi:hypothetical protein